MACRTVTFFGMCLLFTVACSGSNSADKAGATTLDGGVADTAGTADTQRVDVFADGAQVDTAVFDTLRDRQLPDQTSLDRLSVDTPHPDGAGSDATQVVDLEDIIGWVTVREDKVWAAIYDSPPYFYIYEKYFVVDRQEGYCQLRTREPLGFCDPACLQYQFCAASNTCVDLSEYATAGDLFFSGLTEPVTLVPSSYGYPAMTQPATASFYNPGANISVTAQGGATRAFAAQATGVEPLEMLTPNDFEVTQDQDVTLRWTPGTAGHNIEILITPWIHAMTDLGTHVRCRMPDTGEVTIPASMLWEVINVTCIGMMCGSFSHIVRYSESFADVNHGWVRFRVESFQQLTPLR